MSIKGINEAFEKLYKDIKPEKKRICESADRMADLRTALGNALMTTSRSGADNIKAYEIAFQDAIESVFPDNMWWEVTDCNIFNSLLEKKDPPQTIIEIIRGVKPEFKGIKECKDSKLGEGCKKRLEEGTSNFWSMDDLPLLIFGYYEDVYDRVWDMTADDLRDKIESGEIEEDDIPETSEFEENWDKYFDYCVLDEDEVSELQSDIDQFNHDSYYSDDYDPYEDDYGTYEDNEIKVEIKPGYYEAAQLYCNTKYLNDVQKAKVKAFFDEMKKKYGLTELGVSWRASNGETGYHKVDEGFFDDRTYRVSYKANGIYQNALVKAGTKQEASDKVTNEIKGAKVVGITTLTDVEIQTAKDKGMPIIEQAKEGNIKTNEAYGWADDYWHDVANDDSRRKEFLDWINADDARLQSAYDWYKGNSKDALHELVVDFLDEKFTEPIDDDGNTWTDETYDIWYKSAKKAINELGFYQFQDEYVNEGIIGKALGAAATGAVAGAVAGRVAGKQIAKRMNEDSRIPQKATKLKLTAKVNTSGHKIGDVATVTKDKYGNWSDGTHTYPVGVIRAAYDVEDVSETLNEVTDIELDKARKNVFRGEGNLTYDEIRCIDMINSILAYNEYLNDAEEVLKRDEESTHSYLGRYIKVLGRERVKELIQGQLDDIERIEKDTFTDSEGVSYNTIIWKR